MVTSQRHTSPLTCEGIGKGGKVRNGSPGASDRSNKNRSDDVDEDDCISYSNMYG